MEKGFVRRLWKIPTETQVEMLVASGVASKDIYNADAGENIDACIMSFRSRGGIIKIAADLRVFGDSQGQIAKTVSLCEQEGIKIIDLANPELKTVAAQLRHAFARIAFMRRWDGDKRKARRMGAQGGRAKAEHQAVKRAEIMPEDAVRRLLGKIGKNLTWRDAEEVTTFSTATLRRHYL